MNTSTVQRYSIASAVLVAVLAGSIVYWRATRSNAPGSGSSDPEVMLRPEFTVGDNQSGMRRYRSGDTHGELTRAVLERMDESLASEDPHTRMVASELIGTRAALLFEPDYDAWRSRVVESGGEEALPVEDETFMKMWEGSVKPYTNPMVDVSGIRVERIDPDRGFPETQPGTICMRSAKQVRANYKPLDSPVGSGADTRESIEVFVPVRIRDAAGKDLGATISFVLGRSRPSESWRELEMFVYMGSEARGRELMFPPF